MMLERLPYRGWPNAYRLSNRVVELIVTADVGPRILFYGFCGRENMLHEVNDDAGKVGGSQFRLYGGHRLWVSPPRWREHTTRIIFQCRLLSMEMQFGSQRRAKRRRRARICR